MTHSSTITRNPCYCIKALHPQSLYVTVSNFSVKTRDKQCSVFISQRGFYPNTEFSGNFKIRRFITKNLIIAFFATTPTGKLDQPKLFYPVV